MTQDQFWNIIADSRQDFDSNRREGNLHLQAQRLADLLSDMSADRIQEFDRFFTQLTFDAYRWDLWGAAYIIHGGCSDDSFQDFRYWLVLMGRQVYEAAMANPESLADIADRPGVEPWVPAFEEFNGLPGGVIDEKGSSSGAPLEFHHPRDPIGERWNDDDLPRLFPNLWTKFWNHP